MRKHCSNVRKFRPCLATESTNSARMRTIVTAALQRQYSQTELIFWITLVQILVLSCQTLEVICSTKLCTNQSVKPEIYIQFSSVYIIINYYCLALFS